jgi:hypothetical protein
VGLHLLAGPDRARTKVTLFGGAPVCPPIRPCASGLSGRSFIRGDNPGRCLMTDISILAFWGVLDAFLSAIGSLARAAILRRSKMDLRGYPGAVSGY